MTEVNLQFHQTFVERK